MESLIEIKPKLFHRKQTTNTVLYLNTLKIQSKFLEMVRIWIFLAKWKNADLLGPNVKHCIIKIKTKF